MIVPRRHRQGEEGQEGLFSRRLRLKIAVAVLALSVGAGFLIHYLTTTPPDPANVSALPVRIDSVWGTRPYNARQSKEVQVATREGTFVIEQVLWSGRIEEDSLVARLGRAGSCTIYRLGGEKEVVVGIVAPGVDLPPSLGLKQLRDDRASNLYVGAALLLAALGVGISIRNDPGRRRDA